MKRLLAVVAIATLLSLRAAADPPAEDAVLRWIDQLASDGFEERETAQKNLQSLKSSWRPFLQKRLATQTDPEARMRLQQIVDQCGKPRWCGGPDAALAAAKAEGRPILAFSTPGGPSDFA
jgi:hypothetical protein